MPADCWRKKIGERKIATSISIFQVGYVIYNHVPIPWPTYDDDDNDLPHCTWKRTPDNADQGMIWVHPLTAAFGRKAQINFSGVHPSSVGIFPWSHIPLSTWGQTLHWLVKYSPPAYHESPQWAKWWNCQWARNFSTSCALLFLGWVGSRTMATPGSVGNRIWEILSYISMLKLSHIFISRIHFFCPPSVVRRWGSIFLGFPIYPRQLSFTTYSNIPSSSIQIMNNEEFLKLDALSFQQVYTKLQTQKSVIVAAVRNLLARRRTGGGEDDDWKDNSNTHTKGYMRIFPHFWRFFRGQIHFSTCDLPGRIFLCQVRHPPKYGVKVVKNCPPEEPKDPHFSVSYLDQYYQGSSWKILN